MRFKRPPQMAGVFCCILGNFAIHTGNLAEERSNVCFTCPPVAKIR